MVLSAARRAELLHWGRDVDSTQMRIFAACHMLLPMLLLYAGMKILLKLRRAYIAATTTTQVAQGVQAVPISSTQTQRDGSSTKQAVASPKASAAAANASSSSTTSKPRVISFWRHRTLPAAGLCISAGVLGILWQIYILSRGREAALGYDPVSSWMGFAYILPMAAARVRFQNQLIALSVPILRQAPPPPPTTGDAPRRTAAEVAASTRRFLLLMRTCMYATVALWAIDLTMIVGLIYTPDWQFELVVGIGAAQLLLTVMGPFINAVVIRRILRVLQLHADSMQSMKQPAAAGAQGSQVTGTSHARAPSSTVGVVSIRVSSPTPAPAPSRLFVSARVSPAPSAAAAAADDDVTSSPTGHARSDSTSAVTDTATAAKQQLYAVPATSMSATPASSPAVAAAAAPSSVSSVAAARSSAPLSPSAQQALWRTKLALLRKSLMPTVFNSIYAILLPCIPWLTWKISYSMAISMFALPLGVVVQALQAPTDF